MPGLKWITAAALIAGLASAACSERSEPPPAPPLSPPSPTGAPLAAQGSTPAARGAAMLKRELGYLATLAGRSDRAVTVAINQVGRTLDWYEGRQLPIPSQVQTVASAVDLVRSEGPGPPPEPPPEPVYEEPEYYGAQKIRGFYKGAYHGGTGDGFILLRKGEYVILRAEIKGDVRMGDPVSGYGAPTNAYARITVDGQIREADIFFFADEKEYREDKAKQKEEILRAKAAHMEAMREYEKEKAAYRAASLAYQTEVSTFPARRVQAIASLPSLAGAAAATL